MTPRDRDVLDVLTASGTARVETLARKLGVTEETIRRAAKRLEAQGLVTKTHGALHLREAGAEPNFAQRMQLNAAAKRRIGRSVAALIPDGASLFLDVGSTTAYVAQALQIRRDLMVITNSLPVASALTGRNGNRVFLAGGELRAHDGGAFAFVDGVQHLHDHGDVGAVVILARTIDVHVAQTDEVESIAVMKRAEEGFAGDFGGAVKILIVEGVLLRHRLFNCITVDRRGG